MEKEPHRYIGHSCPALEYVELPSTLKTILNEAFRGCTKLTNLRIPDGVTTIDDVAFIGVCGYDAENPPQAGDVLGHEYTVDRLFSDDFNTCTITFTCIRNAEHTHQVVVETIKSDGKATATYSLGGKIHSFSADLPSEAGSSEGSDGGSNNTILYIGIGCVVVIIVVAGAVLFMRRQ